MVPVRLNLFPCEETLYLFSVHICIYMHVCTIFCFSLETVLTMSQSNECSLFKFVCSPKKVFLPYFLVRHSQAKNRYKLDVAKNTSYYRHNTEIPVFNTCGLHFRYFLIYNNKFNSYFKIYIECLI